MEMMVALVLFSSLIAWSSRYLASAVKRPYVTERVEPWLTLMEESRQALMSLPEQAELLLPGSHDNPFPGLTKPPDLESWKLEWQECNQENLKAAHFTATTQQGRIVDWTLYHAHRP